MIRALAGETRLDQLARRLAGRSDIIFVDPRRALLAGKARLPVYSRTDTHWNEYGAFLAYRELMTALARAGAAVAVPREEDFRLRRRLDPPGDLSVLSGVPGFPQEEGVSMRRLVEPPYRVVTLPADPETGRAAFACETDDKRRPRLAMFRDSFAVTLFPLLCPDFSRSTYSWRYAVVGETLDAEKPAILVLEITERFLGEIKKKGFNRSDFREPPGSGKPKTSG
jgi:alginate O-acetyltransferase complex protein AlgJ